MSDKDTKAFEPLVPDLTSVISSNIDQMSFEEQGLLFCELSILAYTGVSFGGAKAIKMGFTTIKRFSIDGFVGFLFANETDLVIAFRGINVRSFDNFDDTINISFGPHGAHKGFVGALSGLWKVMSPSVDKLRTSRKVWVTGHSLGGALSLILAGLCIDLEVEAIHSFGAPRAGSLGFSSSIKTPHARWVNHHDVVTHMPPVWKGYAHHGEEYYFGTNGVPVTTFFGRVKRTITKFFDWMRFDGLADHSIFNYRAMLLDLQERNNG